MLENCVGARELRERVDRIGVRLILRLGRRADAAGRDLGVLLLQRGHDVAGVEALRCELDRIDPDAHRVLALAEDADLRDAGHAREVVDDVELRVVAQEEGIVLRGVRRQRDAHDERAGVLGDLNADLLHRLRQLADRGLNGVLHVGGGDVEIGFEREGTGDRRNALRALRADVAQALNGVDRLFERRRHLRLDGLRAPRRRTRPRS